MLQNTTYWLKAQMCLSYNSCHSYPLFHCRNVHFLQSEHGFSCQECVFEELQAKQAVFQAVENHVGEDTILSSSTSCLMPSNIFSLVQNPKRCLISHPVSEVCTVTLYFVQESSEESMIEGRVYHLTAPGSGF